MTTQDEWDIINDKIEEVTRLIQKSGLTMISGTFGVDPINNWQYKIMIPKKHQKRVK